MTKCLADLFVLVLVMVAVSGCATLTESSAERCHVAGKVEGYNVMLFNEEFDNFWLIDSPSRLSKWIIR
jgi:hypothetical protein